MPEPLTLAEQWRVCRWHAELRMTGCTRGLYTEVPIEFHTRPQTKVERSFDVFTTVMKAIK